MKLVLFLLLFIQIVQAQTLSKHKLLGSWELSSMKENSFVVFGTYIGTTRGESIKLVFQRNNKVKVFPSGDVYEYELQNSQLKIYQLRKAYNNKLKKTHHYDLFSLQNMHNGCYSLKILKKKIVGYNPHKKLKMCEF